MSKVGGAGNDDLQRLMLKIDSEKDRQSGASQAARDAMEAMNPLNVIGGLAQTFMKVIGAISG